MPNTRLYHLPNSPIGFSYFVDDEDEEMAFAQASTIFEDIVKQQLALLSKRRTSNTPTPRKAKASSNLTKEGVPPLDKKDVKELSDVAPLHILPPRKELEPVYNKRTPKKNSWKRFDETQSKTDPSLHEAKAVWQFPSPSFVSPSSPSISSPSNVSPTKPSIVSPTNQSIVSPTKPSMASMLSPMSQRSPTEEATSGPLTPIHENVKSNTKKAMPPRLSQKERKKREKEMQSQQAVEQLTSPTASSSKAVWGAKSVSVGPNPQLLNMQGILQRTKEEKASMSAGQVRRQKVSNGVWNINI